MPDNADRSYLVVVGSSAGGIDALSMLVATLPTPFPAALVIAQHLDPHHESRLADILARSSTLPIRSATTGATLESGCVYVVPANQHVEIQDGTLVLSEAGTERSKPSIDRLFTTAAAAYGERLIAVILSGTGSDGAAGARAVKQAGGMVIIQNPATASFPGMPLALAPTTVDLVAELAQVGPLLQELVRGQRVPPPQDERQTLSRFLESIRDRSGLDFTQYRLPTIQRRLQRRLVATHTQTLDDYAAYLEAHPEEGHQLIASFLINVTEFFRDSELFTLLEQRVLPELLDHAKQRGDALRLWSAGCATGEEAYSLALLVAEALGEHPPPLEVRIFATDVDAEAVAFARRAIYPASAMAHVPARLLERYFLPEDGHYQLTKRVRGLTVFGQHDLGQSAPFRQIDLVLCRNVLIYFTPDLQQRALELFAYALRDDGYLVLGKAETVGPLTNSFIRVDTTHKLFRRQGERLIIPPARLRTLPDVAPSPPPDPPAPATHLGVAHPPPVESPPRTPAEEIIQVVPLGVVVIDRHYDIRLLNRAARSLLAIQGVALGEDLIHLTKAIPPLPLRALIDQAFRVPEAPISTELAATDPLTGLPRTLHLSVSPYQQERGGARPETVLLVIWDLTAQAEMRQTLEQELQRSLADLERVRQEAAKAVAEREELLEVLRTSNRQLSESNYELTRTVEDLHITSQQFQVRTEEAQAVSEEAETLNEELQATNEELATLNEENQATNEEIQATNEELQARSEEMEALLQERETERVRVSALLHSVQDAVALIGPDGKVQLSNTAFRTLLGDEAALFIAGDASGQPIPPETRPLARAARGDAFQMVVTLLGPEGGLRWFEARGEPIRDAAGQPLGGVLVLHPHERAPT